MKGERLALYTTVHPGARKYLSAWLRSARAQTDPGFDVWIGLDGVTPEEAVEAMAGDPGATWVRCEPGATPTQIRERAIEQLTRLYPGVVFADADDLLEPERVERARHALDSCDVCGCAMRIVDEAERDTGLVFRPPEGAERGWELLARANCFGLGNTAYRSAVLRRCLPLPAECVMEDWFIVTRAWTQGARLRFEPECGMAYRQHGNNMTAVLPPFTEALVLRETRSVLQHYDLVLSRVPELRPEHRRAIGRARDDALEFARAFSGEPATRRRYLEALNRLPPEHVWFDCVAHPALEAAWKS